MDGAYTHTHTHTNECMRVEPAVAKPGLQAVPVWVSWLRYSTVETRDVTAEQDAAPL